MRLALRQRSVGRRDAAVGADHAQGVREHPAHVRLVELEVDHVRRTAQRVEHVGHRLFPVEAQRRADLLDGLTLPGLVRRRWYPRDDDRVPSLHPGGTLADAGDDALALDRTAEAGEERRCAALVRPVGQERAKPRTAGDIGVGVVGHVYAAGTGGLHHLQRLGRLTPVGRAGRLVVGDLYRQLRTATDLDCLVYGVEERVAFPTDMAEIESAAPRRDLGQGDNLVRVRIRARRVDKPGRQAKDAVVQGLSQEAAHRRQLIGGRRAALHPHDFTPQGGVAGQGRHVDGHTLAAHSVAVFTEGPPVAPQALPGGPFADPAVEEGAIKRPHRSRGAAAVADHDRGDTLPYLTLRRWVDQKRQVGVGVRVNEPRGDEAAGGVEHGRGRGSLQLTIHLFGRRPPFDGSDLAVLDGDVGTEPGGARPVNHLPALDQHVYHALLLSRAC